MAFVKIKLDIKNSSICQFYWHEDNLRIQPNTHDPEWTSTQSSFIRDLTKVYRVLYKLWTWPCTGLLLDFKLSNFASTLLIFLLTSLKVLNSIKIWGLPYLFPIFVYILLELRIFTIQFIFVFLLNFSSKIDIQGLKEAILTRDFIQFILHSEVGQSLRIWCHDITFPEEIFIQTLIRINQDFYNQNGGRVVQDTDLTQDYTQGICIRRTLWEDTVKYCHGKIKRYICNLALADFPEVFEHKCLFLNKFSVEVDGTAITCLHHHLTNFWITLFSLFMGYNTCHCHWRNWAILASKLFCGKFHCFLYHWTNSNCD